MGLVEIYLITSWAEGTNTERALYCLNNLALSITRQNSSADLPKLPLSLPAEV